MKMRFSEWADFVNGFTSERPKGLRLGQWAFNLLHDSHPKIAYEINGTGIDPFYRDDHIPAFLSELLKYVVMDDLFNDPVAAPRNDELELRRMLAFSYAGASLYVNDGELQDNSRLPVIDFKRDSVEEIQEKMRRRAAGSGPAGWDLVRPGAWQPSRQANIEFAAYSRKHGEAVRKQLVDSAMGYRSVEDASITDAEKTLLSSDPPDHSGYWYVICDEVPAAGLVRVVHDRGGLIVKCPDLGDCPVGFYHNGLTETQWLEVRRCCHAWADYFGVTIMDPDGWRRNDDVTVNTPITAQDFAIRYAQSTVEHGRRGPRSEELNELCRAWENSVGEG